MTENNQVLDPESIQCILEARARVLAQPPQSERTVESEGLLVLALGAERYGVHLSNVQEVRVLSAVTPMPGVPPFWAGLLNLRGHLYPVLDLRRYLALPQSDTVESRRVVLVAAAGLEVALMVDDVLGVRNVYAAEIGSLFTETANVKSEIVLGVTPDLLSVLDLEALLSDPRLVVQDEVI